MRKTCALIVFSLVSFSLIPNVKTAQSQTFEFEYQPGPVNNPLKGLVPYCGKHGPFPCSMEFWYFPINELMPGLDEFDWQPIEEKLEKMKSRGHQAVIRPILEYPGRKSAVPDFLLEQGVKISKYRNGDSDNLTPDYQNPNLIAAMEKFIDAFGNKYDGDPRVGFITMGVLGQWGEWHTHPQANLFAKKPAQKRIQDAFAKAFKKTKVLMRYPAGKDDQAYAENASYPFGYHDDSFAYATLDTGRQNDAWFFESKMKSAGTRAVEKWKTQPIGGEIRPEVWGCVFDTPSCVPKGQEFDQCVQRTHASWLMDSGMFKRVDRSPTIAQIAAATTQVQKMGYELFISKATVVNDGSQATVELSVENRGVAPFYYQWPVELVAIDARGRQITTTKMDWDLSQIIPGEPPVVWKGKIKTDSIGIANIGVRVPNPMENGHPLRFANSNLKKSGMLILKNDQAMR